MADWEQLREEYIHSEVSLRELARKHQLPYAAVSRQSAAEGWSRQRKARQKDAPPKASQPPATLQTVADKLLQRIQDSVEGDAPLDTRDIRALVSAVKDLSAIREACPDLERMARCAELEEKLGGTDRRIQVIFQAGEAEWNE